MEKTRFSTLKLAACSATLPQFDRSGLLDFMAQQGLEHVELGVGGYPGTAHASAHELLRDTEQQNWWRHECAARGLSLAALSCHGNPLHPDLKRAQAWHLDFIAALEAANALEVPVVVGFSGQPGTGGVPNWPVVAWPDEYADLHERQWQDQLIPYWQGVSNRAQELGVTIAIEMHGGFAVHSPATLLRLRNTCGPALAANLDPSHLWWQNIDPAAAARLLGPAIAHVHLKDTRFNPQAMNLHGLLDLTPHHRAHDRAWHFAVPGDGHDACVWSGLLNVVLEQGFDGVFSIEHEAPMPVVDGIKRCLSFIRGL